MRISIVYVFIAFLVTGCGGGSGGASTNPDINVPVITQPPSNNPPEGSVTIVGSYVESQTLSIAFNITDADGLGELSYQWLRDGSAISGATDANYVISDTDVGALISVVISYTDGAGAAESIIASSTEVVLAANTEPASTQPNILLIISDDQGLDASAQYPYSTDVPSTPTLDQLAQNGITFDNAWATPACATTRATLMTGMHGLNSGISSVPGRLDTNLISLPRYLKETESTNNYVTAAFGKWYLAGSNGGTLHPNETGFDFYAGNLNASVEDYYSWQMVANGVETTVNEYHTTKVTDMAIDWVAEQQSPWFVWLAYSAPHSPFHLPPSHLHSRSDLTGSEQDINSRTREYYLAAIEAMDNEIGRFLSNLSEEERRNTFIVFVGDNGTPAGVIDEAVFSRNHGKNSLYEGGIRVPFVVSGAGVTRQNERESAIVNTTDVYTTIGQVAGIETSQVYDSVSFYSLLSGDASEAREFNFVNFVGDRVEGWSARNSKYKLIQHDSGEQELYDVEQDISELNNLLSSGQDFSDVLNLLVESSASVER